MLSRPITTFLLLLVAHMACTTPAPPYMPGYGMGLGMCTVLPAERISCGWPGMPQMTRMQCLYSRCCYDNSTAGAPSCYRDAGYGMSLGMCTVLPAQRISCGWPGMPQMTRMQCLHRRCCYDNSTAGAPSCYRDAGFLYRSREFFGTDPEEGAEKRNDARAVGMCAVAPAQRISCGPGMTQLYCTLARCCFDSTIPGAPTCYRDAGYFYRSRESNEWFFGTDPEVETEKRNAVRAVGMCGVSPVQRISCGWPGMTQSQCLYARCCYDNTAIGAPACYRDAGYHFRSRSHESYEGFFGMDPQAVDESAEEN